MKKLYLKLHPSYLVWMVDKENYGVVSLTSNLLLNGDVVFENLSNEIKHFYPTEIIVEKPFLKIKGENTKKLADDIIHVQRNFGSLLYIIHTLFPDADIKHISSKVARESVYKREDISKDTQLSEVNVLLKGIKQMNFAPLILLGLHDLLVLRDYNEKRK